MTENRDELHHLIDSLPEEQVELVLADIRRRFTARPVARGQCLRLDRGWSSEGPHQAPVEQPHIL